jgi:hypothetical protein
VYVLPNTEPCREDFEWIRSEIISLGGEASVFAAAALDAGDDDLVAAFQRARDADYQALTRDADRILSMSRAKRRPAANRDERGRAVRRMRQRFNEIERIDFFHAPAGHHAAAAVAAVERLAAAPEQAAVADRAPLAPAAFQQKRWVTRPRPGVDRMASAWLIRRCIDPKATFGFVQQPADGDVPFDMYTGEFSHQGTSCTFEMLVRRFNVVDPAVARIGEIVHDLDMKEQRYEPVEAPAVARMVDGLRDLHPDDDALLQHGMAMFEALARSFSATESAAVRTVKSRRPRKRRTR